MLVPLCITFATGDAEAAELLGAGAPNMIPEVEEEEEQNPDITNRELPDHLTGEDENDPDPMLHSGFLFVVDSDSEEEGQITDDAAQSTQAQHTGVRQKAVSDRPEFKELMSLGLVARPEGCSLGVHPGAQVWRGYGSSHYGRSFGASSGRTAKQAVLRVLELMLLGYLQSNPKNKLAKSQSARAQQARAAEPGRRAVYCRETNLGEARCFGWTLHRRSGS